MPIWRKVKLDKAGNIYGKPLFLCIQEDSLDDVEK